MPGFEVNKRENGEDSIIEISSEEGTVSIVGDNRFVMEALVALRSNSYYFQGLIESVFEDLSLGEILDKMRTAEIADDAIKKFITEKESSDLISSMEN